MARIIIVEDDPMIAEIYQRKFSDSGFEVLTATSGDQVLNIAKKEKIDVVLLDLIMPKMDGFEVTKNLRNGGYDPNIQILIFSNLNQQDKVDQALKVGANGFIAKSNYTPSELVAEVKRRLNQYEEQKKNEERRTEAMIAKNTGENRTEKKRILIIEDEEIFIELFGEKLRQDGYEVVTAKNGAWGVKEALNGDFDLFLIDMVMPAMTGEEMVARLKLEEKTKNTPIIILSASAEDSDAKRVEKMGIAAFIIKTKIIPSELSKKIAEILNTQ